MVDKLYIPKESSKIHMDFFNRDSETVAKDLLGRVMVHKRGSKSPIYVQLNEIAAYEGFPGNDEDKARKKHGNLFMSPGVMGVSSAYGNYLIDVGTRNKDEASCITLIGGDLFDRRGLREQAKGPGKLSKALEIDSSYDNAPINFGQLWIGGEPIEENQILKRNKSKVPENCIGYFYFK